MSEQNKMWILSQIIQYEGEEILGVFSSEEKAFNALENKEKRYDKSEYKKSSEKNGWMWIKSNNGKYYIAPFEIDCLYEHDTGVARREVK